MGKIHIKLVYHQYSGDCAKVGESHITFYPKKKFGNILFTKIFIESDFSRFTRFIYMDGVSISLFINDLDRLIENENSNQAAIFTEQDRGFIIRISPIMDHKDLHFEGEFLYPEWRDKYEYDISKEAKVYYKKYSIKFFDNLYRKFYDDPSSEEFVIVRKGYKVLPSGTKFILGGTYLPRESLIIIRNEFQNLMYEYNLDSENFDDCQGVYDLNASDFDLDK